MNKAGPSENRSRPRRRGRRRPRRNRGSKPAVSQVEVAAKEKATLETENPPPRKVFIYTYTIRKGG